MSKFLDDGGVLPKEESNEEEDEDDEDDKDDEEGDDTGDDSKVWALTAIFNISP